MPSACFRIDGPGLGRTLRSWMFEGRWREAYRLVTEDLSGDPSLDMHALGIDVLEGRRTFENDGDGVAMVECPEDERDAMDEHRRELARHFAGRVRIDECWHKPVAVVTSYGKKDAYAAGDQADMDRWWKRRAEHYAIGNEIAKLIDGEYVLFAPCGDPPSWWPVNKTPREAVANAKEHGRGLTERGAATQYYRASNEARSIIASGDVDPDDHEELLDIAGAADAAMFRVQLVKWRAEVIEQAGDDRIELRCKDGRTFNVPRAPFVHWAMRGIEIDAAELPEWREVCPSGLRLQTDSSHHTDWLIAIDMPIRDAYLDPQIKTASWDAAEAVQLGYRIDLDREIEIEPEPAQPEPRPSFAGVMSAMTLLQDSTRTCTVIVAGDALTGVVGESVAVLPDLGTTRTEALARSQGVISELGGELCHLAILARGTGKPVVRVKDACTLYPPGTRVCIDTRAGHVTIVDD